MNILAVSNNDVALVAWSFDHKIPQCLGFAVYRIDVNAGTETCLPALATFPGQDPAPNRTTADDPIQKFFWKDLYAVRGGLYKYKIVPLTGTPGNLTPLNMPPLISNAVSITAQRGLFSAYFNRGILATQATAHAIDTAAPGFQTRLLDNIKIPGNPLRQQLAGQMIDALLALVKRAEVENGDCYAALYELEDDQLVAELQKLTNRLHIVLSNLQGSTPKKGTAPTPNAPPVNDADHAYRLRLEASHADKYDRIFKSGQIGHNKFVVYVKDNEPRAVLFGSTNWTYHGLCAQSNNSLIVESPTLAHNYFQYWQMLKQDTVATHGDPKQLQAASLRSADAAQEDSSGKTLSPITLEDNSATIDLWFSPNTKGLRGSPSKPKSGKKPAAEATPPDMSEVFTLIGGASQAILFLAFQPGSPSIVNAIVEAQKNNPHLFVRGAVTDPGAAGTFETLIKGSTVAQRATKPTASGTTKKPVPPADYRVVPATGINDAFGQWEKELYKAGHAVIHDKIVVIDPFSTNCVVITGSHNLGYRASHNNDENMAIIKGHRPLVEAYATHVLDVYDHYVWRYWLNHPGNKQPFKMLTPNDTWQDKYFSGPGGTLSSAEVRFWLSSSSSATATPVSTDSVLVSKPPAPVTEPEIAAHLQAPVHIMHRTVKKKASANARRNPPMHKPKPAHARAPRKRNAARPRGSRRPV